MTNIESLVFYILAFILAATFIHVGELKKSKMIVAAGLILPTLVGGLRYMVGADYNSYDSKIHETANMGFFEFSNTFHSMEPSLWIIGRLSDGLFGNSVLFFLLTSFLTVLFFYLGVKKFGVKHIGLVMFLLLMIIFPQTLSGVRQGVAIALSFYAFSHIPSKQLLRFIFIILSASLFHYSAIVMLAIYPLYAWIIDRSTTSKEYLLKVFIIIISSPVVLIGGLYSIQFLPLLSKYSYYYTDLLEKYAHLEGTHNILPELFALAFMTVFYTKIVTKSQLGQFSFLMVILMTITTSLGLFLPLAGRFADYFMPMFLLIFPSVIGIFRTKLKPWTTLFIVLYAIAFFIGAFLYMGSGRIFPYQFIF